MCGFLSDFFGFGDSPTPVKEKPKLKPTITKKKKTGESYAKRKPNSYINPNQYTAGLGLINPPKTGTRNILG